MADPVEVSSEHQMADTDLFREFVSKIKNKKATGSSELTSEIVKQQVKQEST